MILWRRRDVPGFEACRLDPRATGWELAGTAVFVHEGQACRLDYVVACDPRWLTRSATVRGWIGERTIDATVVRDGAGQWRLDGRPCEAVGGCVDVDLNFSPSTNLLPIRRLDLAVGGSARVRAAWLRFPGFVLEPLEQTYTRVGPRAYRYESAGGGFVADLRVDEQGLVVDYGEVWAREAPTAAL
jgi:hypothetical protein